MNKKEALTQLEIMATNATGRLGEAKSEEERALLYKHIEALNMAMDALKDCKPKVGEWEIEEIRSIYGEGYRLTCSECGDTFTVTENAFPYERYCRHCGAKMEMGVDPNNCRNCDLANECDLHICIKGVRKRMGERSNERSKRCKGCEYARDRHAQDGWHFHGCFHKPYSGEWIAEIENCPKERSKE